MPALFRLKKLLSRLCLTFVCPWMLLLVCALTMPRHLPVIVPLWLALVALGAILGPLLLNHLAHRYPQLDPHALPQAPCYLIAVAGSGYRHHPHRAPDTWFTDELATRMAEAGRIAQQLNALNISYHIIVSIPEHPHQTTRKLQGLHAFFRRFQVPSRLISVLDHVLDSEDEIMAFRQHGQPIIMVSSNWHVPRFITMGRALGCTIYPAPAGYLYEEPARLRHLLHLPTASGLSALECVLHEGAGTIVFNLKSAFRRRH